MADLNEEKEILLPEDDGQQVLDSPSESHELEVSRQNVREKSQGTLYMYRYLHNVMSQRFWNRFSGCIVPVLSYIIMT